VSGNIEKEPGETSSKLPGVAPSKTQASLLPGCPDCSLRNRRRHKPFPCDGWFRVGIEPIARILGREQIFPVVKAAGSTRSCSHIVGYRQEIAQIGAVERLVLFNILSINRAMELNSSVYHNDNLIIFRYSIRSG